jgi:hypothetical protein
LTLKSSVDASGVQNLVDSSLSEFRRPNEVILRWDPHGKFIQFSKGNRLAQHLMVNYSKAKRAFENRGDGFDSILEPYQTLTITGTENDGDALERGRYEVLDFLADIDRMVRYVPDYGWAYPTMPDDNLRDIVDRYVDRVGWFYEEKNAMGLDHVEFIPLGKGLNQEHYLQAVETYQKFGVDRIAMYGVQTPSLKRFVRRVDQATEVFDPNGILVIGKQSPSDVRRLPGRVNGTAGFWNWKQACNLTADGYSSEDFVTWYYKTKEALQDGRTDRQIGLDSSYETEVRTDGWGK